MLEFICLCRKKSSRNLKNEAFHDEFHHEMACNIAFHDDWQMQTYFKVLKFAYNSRFGAMAADIPQTTNNY